DRVASLALQSELKRVSAHAVGDSSAGVIVDLGLRTARTRFSDVTWWLIEALVEAATVDQAFQHIRAADIALDERTLRQKESGDVSQGVWLPTGIQISFVRSE